MKHKPILLLCLLVGPALARPNAAPEPIYYRSSPQSNPLEVTEELIPTTLAIASSNDQDQPQDMPKALELKGTTTTTTTTTTTEVPVTTTAAQDQNSRYTKYAEPDVLSSESIIKDFFLKNLANFQKESGNLGAIPSLVEEPNTLRSVSLTGPTWGDPGPDPQYGYTNVRKKPVIHKIITKWSDKTQDAFNVDFTGQHGIVTPGHLLGNFAGTTGFIAFPTATPVPVIIVAKPVYPENQQLSLLDNGYSPEPVRDVVYGSAEPQNDVYGESGYSPEPVRDVVYGSDPQNDVYEPLNDGYQVQQDPIDSGYAEPPKQASKKKKKKNKNKTKKPEKQQQTQMSDPDRPDAAYFNDQVEQFEPSNGWNTGQDDPYEEKDPYADALGALKDQPVIECNGIRISVNGKEACDEIEVTINRVDEITKNGFVPPPPLIPPVVPVAPAAAADSVPAAAGNAAAVAADPAAAVAPPVANDASLFAAPLDPLASIPAVPPPLPGPISFLTSPIGNLMNNLVQPTRLGTGPGTSGGNKHKHKPHHDHDSTVLSDDSGGGGGMLTDTSHALFGMLAALSAMTPMNIIVMALASLPVMALVMAGVGAGMYMYSKFTPPIKNYSTIVVKRPLPVVPASIQHHHRYRQPVKASASTAGSASSSGWFDFGDMWNNIGWTANDRRGVGKVAGKKPTTGPSRRPSSRVVQPAYRLSPYRGHGSRPEAKSKMATVTTTTTKRTGRR